MMLFLIASGIMGALWMAAYLCAKGKRRISHMIVIQVGRLFVWPLLTVTSAMFSLDWIYEGIDDPVIDPVIVIVPAGAAVATFTIWMVGVSVPSWLGARWRGDARRDGLSI